MRLMTLGLLLLTNIAAAQNLVPNPSFEQGLTSPTGWRLNGGVGKWENFGRTGKRCVSVTGSGNDSNAWECTDWKPEGGKLYLVRYFVRRSPDSVGGTPITGFSTVNRDAWDVPSDGNWHMRQFICRTPIQRDRGQVARDTVLRFGQWHVKGTVAFDDVEVLPVIAVHKLVGHGTGDTGHGERRQREAMKDGGTKGQAGGLGVLSVGNANLGTVLAGQRETVKGFSWSGNCSANGSLHRFNSSQHRRGLWARLRERVSTIPSLFPRFSKGSTRLVSESTAAFGGRVGSGKGRDVEPSHWDADQGYLLTGTEKSPLKSVSRVPCPLFLGTGETIRNGVYRFATNFSGYSSNDSRPLFAHTAGFNTDRWVLGGPMSERWQESGAWVIYRHTLNGARNGGRETSERRIRFETAVMAFLIGYYEGGQLVVEVSIDGKAWREVGRFAPSGEYVAQVPNDLLPADEIWVRFWSTGVLQVNAYRMEAKLSDYLPDATGETWYFAVKRDIGQGTRGMGLSVEPKSLTDDALLVLVKNETAKQRQIVVSLGASGNVKSVKATLKPSSEQIVSVPLPQLVAGEQVVTLTVREGATVVYEAEANVQKPWIEVGGFGYHLAETDAFGLWWCEATYKVGRTTPRPSPRALRPIRIEAARNEYEPFQLVITPKVPLKQIRLRLEPFNLSTRPSPLVPRPVWDEVALVDYVPVTIPTDAWGAVGEFPDPLVPLWRSEGRGTGDAEKAIEVTVENLQANKNQPLWLTVYVPKGVPAGVYRATIQVIEAIDENGKPVPRPSSPVPVELRVFGFTLPDDTPLRTAYGVGIDNDWHRCRTPEQFRQVWDLYMQTCRRYRISPYTPHAYAPIRWEVVGPRTTIDNGVLRLVIDRWQGRIVSVTWDTGQGTRKISPVPRPSSPVPSVGGVLPLLEQFEREGVGWEGKGIAWAGTEVVRDVRIVEQSEKRLVLDITAERRTSQPANRKFAATIRLTVEAGKPYFAVQLLRIVNTDTIRWRINGYFHLLPPDLKPLSAINTDRFGAWLFADPQSQVPSSQIAFGAAGFGFTYSIRINPATGGTHGDVYRPVGKWLEPNEAWEPADEPVAFVFLWDTGQGTGDTGKWEGEAHAEPLKKFVERLLSGEISSQPESKVQITEQPEPGFRYDFSEFDEAMSRYIDEFRFNGFNLVILPERLGGHERFSPEWTELYKRLMAPILEHLKQKGWLKFAYCYWVDEPSPQQYEDVKKGMAALKEACPGVRRLLTFCFDKAPVPVFYDFVDLWVPVMSLFEPQRAKERQALGEEVWWYVCTGPKAPYPNNFIDHPAITHRIRYWMAAKWNLDGDLYWSMTYWRGKGWRLRNPYEDGQSETPEGGYWGNGDGRLLYPPVRQPLPENAEPVIAPPIPSLRLALISEGIEDHCYFWLLKKLREKGHGARDKGHGKERQGRARLLPSLEKALKQADEALASLDRLIRSQTDYERDPKKLREERRKIAEAIEKLVELLGEL